MGFVILASMKNELLLSESLQERDVDIILLEELNCDISFCKFLITEKNLPEITNNNVAYKSVTDYGIGETDILFSYNNNEKRIFVLIENKLDAEFQLNQFKRYQKRAANYLNEKKCDEIFILLIAPNQYCTNQQEFKNFISYEKIRDFFISKKNIRSSFKAKLLTIGIDKLRRGYSAVNDIRVYDLWHQYNNLLQKMTNKLSINAKSLKTVPSKADWIRLRNKNIEKLGLQLIHKLEKGYIDLQITDFNLLKNLKIEKEYSIIQTGKSKSIRCLTNKINRFEPFSIQIETVEKSINDAIRMYDFCIKNFLTSN